MSDDKHLKEPKEHSIPTWGWAVIALVVIAVAAFMLYRNGTIVLPI